LNKFLLCPRQADFILAHGTEALGTRSDGSAAQPCSLERLRELLGECAARGGLPMVVANPDVVTVSGSELRCARRGLLQQGVGPGSLPKLAAFVSKCHCIFCSFIT
jgi:hypothetical protein